MEILANKRLQLPDGWQPSFIEFEMHMKIHEMRIDIKAEYERLYGKNNKISTASIGIIKELRPRGKSERNTKA